MSKNPFNKGIVAKNSIGVGPITREMMMTRAHELAVIAGHSSGQVSEEEYQQASRELHGGVDESKQDAELEAIPASHQWGDPVPLSDGQPVPELANEDAEDDNGQNESAQIVEEGVNEADHDQMIKATRAAKKKA